MIKEPKNIDFFTTGRQPSAKEFGRISEWIKKNKESYERHKPNSSAKRNGKGNVLKQSRKIIITDTAGDV